MASTAEKAVRGAFSSLGDQMGKSLEDERLTVRQRRMLQIQNDFASGRLNTEMRHQDTLQDKRLKAQAEMEDSKFANQVKRDATTQEFALELMEQDNDILKDLRLQGLSPGSIEGRQSIMKMLEVKYNDPSSRTAMERNARMYIDNVLNGDYTPESWIEALEATGVDPQTALIHGITAQYKIEADRFPPGTSKHLSYDRLMKRTFEGFDLIAAERKKRSKRTQRTPTDVNKMPVFQETDFYKQF